MKMGPLRGVPRRSLGTSGACLLLLFVGTHGLVANQGLVRHQSSGWSSAARAGPAGVRGSQQAVQAAWSSRSRGSCSLGAREQRGCVTDSSADAAAKRRGNRLGKRLQQGSSKALRWSRGWRSGGILEQQQQRTEGKGSGDGAFDNSVQRARRGAMRRGQKVILALCTLWTVTMASAPLTAVAEGSTPPSEGLGQQQYQPAKMMVRNVASRSRRSSRRSDGAVVVVSKSSVAASTKGKAAALVDDALWSMEEAWLSARATGWLSPDSPLLTKEGKIAEAGVAGVALLLLRQKLRGKGQGSSAAGAKASVSEVQIAFSCNPSQGNKASTVLTQLDDLAGSADVSSPLGLSKLLEDACAIGTGREGEWVAAKGSFNVQSAKGSDAALEKADKIFTRKLEKERSKWAREPSVTSLSAEGSEAQGKVTSGGGNGGKKDAPTVAVMSLYVLWSRWGSRSLGRKTKVLPPSSVQSKADLKAYLAWLTDEAKAGKGKNLQAVEVLWTPASDADRLEREEFQLKWPSLTSL